MSNSDLHLKNPSCGPTRLRGWRKFFPVTREERDGVCRYRPLWRLIAFYLGGIAVVGYLFLVTAVWGALVFQRGVTAARFIDILLPHRWESVRVQIGDHYVEEGQKHLQARRFREGLASLRAGVAKSPKNLQGRLLLAQLLASAGRPDLAEQTLVAGIPSATRDPAYLRSVFGFLLGQQNDESVQTAARDLLHQSDLPTESRSLAALAAASACYFRGNYDEAEQLLAVHKIASTYDGQLLSAQIDWERGYRELALSQMRALRDQTPTRPEATTQLAAWLRQFGRTDEYRRLTLLRQLASPNSPGPLIERLRVLRSDDPAAAAREATDLLRESNHDENLLLALADYAAEIGDATLARRIYDRCRQLNRGWEAAAFLNVEALIVAHDYRGALDLTRELLDSNRDWAKRYYTLFNSLQAIAYYGLGDSASAKLYLANFLGQSDLRADNLLAVAQRFVDVGAHAEACETLAHAIAVDPRNQAALTRLIELELDLGRIDALPAHLHQLLAMRRPSPEVLRAAAAKLGSDRFLFSRARDAALNELDAAHPTGSL